MSYTCAACGAPILLKSRFTHFVSCLYCKALNVIENDSARIMSGVDLATNFSVLQIGTKGTLNGKSFELIGRLVADSKDGSWNEWCAVDDKGGMYWLSESFGHYYFLREFKDIHDLTEFDSMNIGHSFICNEETYYLQSKDKTTCIGVEGELPIGVHLTYHWLSLDFRSHANAILFVNVDAVDKIFYTGISYEFDELNFSNLRHLY